MSALVTNEPIAAYLEVSAFIDHDHPVIADWVARQDRSRDDECQIVQETYEWVRDRIAHSWDVQESRVTATASEALAHGHGICYAKSHLLAALLRAMAIPSGICYQRLTLGDTPDTGFAVHSLSTVYLSRLGRWIRLDARGNKPGVDARFSLGEERLAFPVRNELGEVDYRINHARPHPEIARTLRTHADCRAMYAHGLPDRLGPVSGEELESTSDGALSNR